LNNLGIWAQHLTSQVSLVPPTGLLLEIRGSLRLFGGPAGLLLRLRRGLRQLGYRAYHAVAPTPLAASVLARTTPHAEVLELHELHAQLAPLPLAALRLPATEEAAFDSIGVTTLGACRRLPRADFARRWSPKLLDLLDRLYGLLPDPRPGLALPTRFESLLELPAEVSSAPALITAGERLLGELLGYLRARAAVATRLRWCLHERGRRLQRFETTHTRPTREFAQMSLLLRETLMRMRLDAPAQALELRVDDCIPEAIRTADLFGPRQESSDEAYAAFADRLRARCGSTAVRRPRLVQDHRPEHACYWQDGQSEVLTGDGTRAVRPVWLNRQPLALPTRGGCPQFDGPLRILPGRERVDVGWWEGQTQARDYFVAVTARGSRVWIYRELNGARRWCLHGIFE
jgi:protein ImuB